MTYPSIKDWPDSSSIESQVIDVTDGQHVKSQPECPKCSGRVLIKRGLDKSKQRYECKFCLHKFRAED